MTVEIPEVVALQALHALEHCAGHLSAQDVARTERDMAGELKYAPLTELAILAAQALRTELAERTSMPTAEHAGRVGADVVHLV